VSLPLAARRSHSPPSTYSPHIHPLQPLLRIYFGSQTGTGENYAKQLKAAGRKHGFRVVNVNLETFARGGKEAMLSTPGLSVFLMSTYGEGDPTDTAVDFTKWLKDTSGDAARPAAGVQYTVFGLGNRQYQYYNQMGKVGDAAGEGTWTACSERGRERTAGQLSGRAAGAGRLRG
jgi:sulfite reductase alpha subunit-like flavoprotein